MRTAARRAALAAVAVGIWVASDQPSLVMEPLFPGQDKVFHLAEFAVVGLALSMNRDLFGPGRPWLMMAAAGLAWGGLDEIHQSWVPGRDCSLMDFAADAAGLALWLVPARLAARRRSTGALS